MVIPRGKTLEMQVLTGIHKERNYTVTHVLFGHLMEAVTGCNAIQLFLWLHKDDGARKEQSCVTAAKREKAGKNFNFFCAAWLLQLVCVLILYCMS